MTNQRVKLDDKYTCDGGHVYITGVQALVRLPMVQQRRDKITGLNTAVYITGYRGSPLGGYDSALWQAKKHLEEHEIKFQPAVNEDLAATACWGTQQAGLLEQSTHDGVVAIWYGKGPGVDRSGDPMKHGNLAGVSKHGGVLVLAGDDHVAKSSTTAHQSEQALVAAMIPILYPASVQELLNYGLIGIALSRYAGTWVGLKCVGDVVESSATVSVDPNLVSMVKPHDFELPDDGVHIRWPDAFLDQEQRLIAVKLEAVKAFVRANRLDHVTHDVSVKRLGIVASGKAWLDVCQALDVLGLDEDRRRALGISVYKVAMPWPLEPTAIRNWAKGHDEILVVEEKRNLIEDQLARALYDLAAGSQLRLVGKRDTEDAVLVPAFGELSATIVAELILRRLPEDLRQESIGSMLHIPPAMRDAEHVNILEERSPWFCAGCPHNTSTRVPNGSQALAGIGCHFMATSMNRETGTFTQMGGEGAAWIGLAPFTKINHMFQNIGDGTYFHSGLLAIRAAVAAGVNITYKILLNDAVAMTGGQPVDGDFSPWAVTHQLAAEGVRRIVVVTDNMEKYEKNARWATGVEIFHRSELDHVQRELRKESGVTAIIYDQVCAAELRRRRKRGLTPEPRRRVVINADVCEGCGDCNQISNCVAVHPLESELGRKRVIDQSACNKDFSCAEGFCPSFVSVEGGQLRNLLSKKDAGDINSGNLSEPVIPKLEHPYNILLTGIGGTGVVTAGALLGMAAHIDGKGSSLLDQTGLAQKNGAVTGQLRILPRPATAPGIRIGAGQADLVIGFDMIVAASKVSLETMSAGRTTIVVDQELTPLATRVEQPDKDLDAKHYYSALKERVKSDALVFVNAISRSRRLLGSTIGANILMLGFVYQKGLLPISGASLEQAIRLNGVSVEANLKAFACGRIAAVEPNSVDNLVDRVMVDEKIPHFDLEEFVAARAKDLVAYQNARYAKLFVSEVRRVQARETEINPNESMLSEAVARSLYKLMAYKDEYEVARLLTSPSFLNEIQSEFEGKPHLRFHLAPPLFARKDHTTGLPKKTSFGPWFYPVLVALSKFKFLRGTVFDPFRLLKDRREERLLLLKYKALVTEICQRLSKDNYKLAVDLAALPQQIRGFGYVKEKSIGFAKTLEKTLLNRFRECSRNVTT